MYRQPPTIETTIEALDELADIRMPLNGLAALTLALANSEMHEPEAIRLVSCLLEYCALTTGKISYQADAVSNDIVQSVRML